MDPVPSLATVSPGPAQRRLAAGVLIVSVVCFAAALPFVRVRLQPVAAFIPIYQSTLALSDVLTAALLFGQGYATRSRALFTLGAGYVFTALMAGAHMLSFPGLFAPAGVLGGNDQTTAWLYMFWHAAFPAFVVAYVLDKNRRRTTARPVRALFAAVGASALIAAALTAAATSGTAALPGLMAGGGYTNVMVGVVFAVWSLSAASIALLVWRRTLSVLDLWLTVVTAAWMFDIALSALLNAGRFDVGFYAGRIYGLFAANFVLLVLLAEASGLYLRLARSFEALAQAHRELEQARERLHHAQKLEVVGQLSGGVAHDFNNLLTAVVGNLDMLQRMRNMSAAQLQLIHGARRAAERGGRLTKQLLAFGRRQRLQMRQVDVNRLLDENEILLRRALGESVELRVEAAADLPPAAIDPDQLQSALLNLILNARDAMPQGGRVTIRTALYARRFGSQAADIGAALGDCIAVSVTDTGTGMSEEVRERAFEPFFTTKEPGKGSGLGLSQIYGFLKQSGGHIEIDTKPGAGSTVTMYVPRAANKDIRSASAEPEVAAAVSLGGTILVVEDDPEVRETAATMLTSLGYRVITAEDGHRALAILSGDEPIDLVFSDVVMPAGISGVDVAREAQRRHNGVRVLLTSGYPREVLAGHGAGDDVPVVVKPYRQDQLEAEIRRALS